MIKFENTEVIGWEHAIRGMRNPLESWGKSDSWYGCNYGPYGKIETLYCNEKCKCDCGFIIGEKDLSLMKRLHNAGTDHRKFLRMIAVYVDITAPLYWWKEFDTYKVGTVANSCSTMHKIADKEFTLDDFSCEYVGDVPNCDPMYSDMLQHLIFVLNEARKCYIDTKDKKYWWQMIQLLPSSYNQKRTVMLNYEVLNNIYKSRKAHRLDEWSNGFKSWIESLPYADDLIMKEAKHEN